MANDGLIPFEDAAPNSGQFLTFIVPAPQGCNLKCPYCVIAQRREVTENKLSPGDFARFIHEAEERGPIFAVAIQGYEPLLPASIPYSQALLQAGKKLRVPTSFVTNGTFLRKATELLSDLTPNKIGISLDAADPCTHDRLRGVSGAWERTVDGIRHAVRHLPASTSLAVISVLFPTKIEQLLAMPRLLKQLGINHWILSPLLRIGHHALGGVAGQRQRIFASILRLQDAANHAVIRLTVDDGQDNLRHGEARLNMPELRQVEFRPIPSGVDLYRLTPSGHCSTGHNILRRLREDAPQWRAGQIHAADFLDQISGLGGGLQQPVTQPSLEFYI